MTATSALVLGTLWVAPTASAAGEDSWISEPSENVFQFLVPGSAATDAAGGPVTGVHVQGNFGDSHNWMPYGAGENDGGWRSTIGPLDPGFYYYEYRAFPEDGEMVAFRNPASPQQVTGKPALNTLFVPGPGAEWLADVPAGGELVTVEYQSTVAKAPRSALVWTPPSYDPDRAEPYPVLYLLQDKGQSHQEWSELGRLGQILDNLAVEGAIEPMVVVMGDGASKDARAEVLDNIVPAARAQFNVSDDPADQAIAGIGRGASQALNLLLTDPGVFTKVGSFSGSLVSSVNAAKAAQINDSTDLIRLYVGNTTDPAYNATVALAEKLTAAGVEFESDGSNPDAGGSWDLWQMSLHDFASRLFQDVEDNGPSEGHRDLVPHSLPAPGTTPTPWVDNGIVTFETGPEFSDASRVELWGNWGVSGSWPQMPMTKQDDGRWRVTFPLDGGSYYYKFIVDGVDHKDANNPSSVVSEPTWSTFHVAGDGVRARFTADVPEADRGEVTIMDYPSTAGEQERAAYVWTPPGYDADREDPYPVLYLQHGGGQTWADWIEVGFAAQILDNHYLQGNIQPMVVVMANGNGVNFPVELTDRIATTVEADYNVSSDPAQRALAGLSMGSGHALSTLWAFPGEFAYIGLFSTFGQVPEDTDVDGVNAGTKLLRIYTGDFQDFTYGATMSLLDSLNDRGVNHEFAPIIPGPHSWDVWQKSLIDFLPRLFTADTSEGIPVEAVIPEGENGVLALTVADYGSGLALSEPENVGDRLRLTGELPEVTVSDSRTAQQAGLGGWAVTVQADAFASEARTITADHLGWTPEVLTPVAGLEAGAPVASVLDGGPGLGTPAELASADSEGRFGSATLGADLQLEVPVGTQPGAYQGQLTVTLFPVD
ncbi:hypothetical protein GCM10028820_26660 [Tessaracoccus terricola]